MALNGVPQMHGLGRLYDPDSRDQSFLMRTFLSVTMEPIQLAPIKIYRRGPALMQGNTGTCVGHAWRSWLDGEPIRTKLGPTPFDLYDACTKRDPWPENDNDVNREYGTSVRTAAKILAELGHIESYLWAFSLDDIRQWVLGGEGGVVLGVDWLAEMSVPSEEGIIRARGAQQGGHAIYLFGMDDMAGMAYLQNSWDRGWGGWRHSINRARVYAGCCKIPYEDLERLMSRRGEACTAVAKAISRQSV